VRISDELLDYLGELYQKYPFKMTFAQFVERVIYKMEKRCRDRVRRSASGGPKKENGSWRDKGISPYDPMGKKVRS
jgi:hypothetical protein